MMFERDSEVIETFIEETYERLAEIERGLLDLEQNRLAVDGDKVHAIFRAAHSIKAGAGLLKYSEIAEVAHRAENILQRIRTGVLVPDSECITALLEAFDSVLLLLNSYRSNNTRPDVQRELAALERYL
ncbi:Hpt domain-containing protein [Desulfovibrio mangrovi]|uniref:Hpt domain-containing protein n=1 Tax=Desulfovibrio mangrovi TaxID=2976983 RepID=UPI0022459AA1|nr:Hpt domain-containing protein [Desulfovibrio mangrovi]UZP65933.1 Hpt domain-containing protein [Desulfovibrio mangrovi]